METLESLCPRPINSQLYRPIKNWQTRLLRLHPGEGNTEISVDLLTVDLIHLGEGAVIHDEQEYVKYEALSYCWGSAVLSFPILVDNQKTLITQSLGRALKHLRPLLQPCFLWADALCINQHDNVEKAVQVQNMSLIYGRATQVVVWLGEAGGPATSVAAEHLRRPKTASAGAIGAEVLAGLMDLVDRPWIRRVWVQQEIFAARKALVICGPETFAFERYQMAVKDVQATNGLRQLGDVQHTGAIEPHIAKNMKALRNMRLGTLHVRANLEIQRQHREPRQKYCRCKNYWPWEDAKPTPEESTNLECILAGSQDLLATDVRDRIFALLSLSNCRASTNLSDEGEQGDATFPVDYSTTPSVVFQNLTKYIINRDRNYGVLEAIDRNVSANDEEVGLPSWCPDWRQFDHPRAQFGGIYQNFIPASYTDVGRLVIKGDRLGTAYGWGSTSWGPKWKQFVFCLADEAMTPCLATLHQSVQCESGDEDEYLLVELRDNIRRQYIVLRPRPSGGFVLVPGFLSFKIDPWHCGNLYGGWSVRLQEFEIF